MTKQSLLIARLFIALAVAGLLSPPVFGDEILSNASVIEMQKLNLGDGVIIDKIRGSKCDFDTSLAALKVLKAANVSDAVIQAMLARNAAPANAPAPVPPPANPNDPAAPHAPGIWLLQESNGAKTLSQVDPERTAEVSHGGFIGPFGAGKVAVTARLTGTSSALQVSRSKPEFYLYVDRYHSDLIADSPNDLTLFQFTVIPKDAKRNANQRAVDIATHGAYASTYGLEKKVIREIESQRIADGVYKIVPRADLADGEYAFCTADAPGFWAGTRGRFYTFGIHTK